MTAPPVIRLRGLRKSFGARRALDGLDLELDGARIVGVVGPDGAGKTTLLRAIAGLLEVEAEEALVLGLDLRGDPTEIKAGIGYVAQTFGLQRELSIVENLRFTARLRRLADDVFRQRSQALLERTGLTAFRDRPAGALSGGMKQKLAIASALLPRPRLVVLDEPTAGVDVVARDEIWALLVEAARESLVLVSTSYLDEMSRCDVLVYLDRGRVVASGTPDELRARVPVELYRTWGGDPRRIAAAAGDLPWVSEARATGLAVRIEVPRETSPGEARVLSALARLGGPSGTGSAANDPTPAYLVERAAVDMEATVLSLAREADA